MDEHTRRMDDLRRASASEVDQLSQSRAQAIEVLQQRVEALEVRARAPHSSQSAQQRRLGQLLNVASKTWRRSQARLEEERRSAEEAAKELQVSARSSSRGELFEAADPHATLDRGACGSTRRRWMSSRRRRRGRWQLRGAKLDETPRPSTSRSRTAGRDRSAVVLLQSLTASRWPAGCQGARAQSAADASSDW